MPSWRWADLSWPFEWWQFVLSYWRVSLTWPDVFSPSCPHPPRCTHRTSRGTNRPGQWSLCTWSAPCRALWPAFCNSFMHWLYTLNCLENQFQSQSLLALYIKYYVMLANTIVAVKANFTRLIQQRMQPGEEEQIFELSSLCSLMGLLCFY